jgi:hypothetical protein
MTLKKITLQLIPNALGLVFLCSCEQRNSNQNELQRTTINPVDLPFSIDTFSNFPSEIDGCACYFSNDSTEFKKGEYIYVNDYNKTSFLRINGNIEKFEQTEFEEVDSVSTIATFKSDLYEMTIKTNDGKRNGDETWLKTGTISVTNINGVMATKTFYGECRC